MLLKKVLTSQTGLPYRCTYGGPLHIPSYVAITEGLGIVIETEQRGRTEASTLSPEKYAYSYLRSTMSLTKSPQCEVVEVETRGEGNGVWSARLSRAKRYLAKSNAREDLQLSAPP